jgi:hypothetical protein
MNTARSLSQDDKSIGGKGLNRKIWTVQATSVSRELGLNIKKQARLTRAYISLREDIFAQGKDKLQGLEGDERKQESDKITRSCVDVFNKKLKKFLNEDQVTRASFDLGSLNKRWDQYLKILNGFGLGIEPMDKASGAVYEYVHKYLLERKVASDSNTNLSGYVATTMKEELDNKIASILNEDQYKEWAQTTAFKGRSK